MTSRRLTEQEETSGTQDAFLEKYDPGAYPRPGVTVDIVLFTVLERTLRVLLIRRKKHPFLDHWALPGGFVRADESGEAAARRELAEETGARDIFLEQLYTFSEPGRDPRTWVISVAHYALVTVDRLDLRAGSDAAETQWFRVRDGKHGVECVPLTGGPAVKLAFDHAKIVDTAVNRIRGKLDYVPIGFQLLPELFTLTELQEVHEAILGTDLDKRNFRSKVQRDGLVKATREMRRGAHRPAQLFRYARPRQAG
ncbi:MAG: NUDIX hydrolase [Deltaproteobacteria bacterium]|nr:NUDIX hydrolase [Deltaproteobacteria bacterium]